MKPETSKKQLGHIKEWVTGGVYAVEVEVEAITYPERPGEPYFTPETVRYLEKLTRLAESGDLASLKKAGTVYVRLSEGAELAPVGASDHGSSAVKESP